MLERIEGESAALDAITAASLRLGAMTRRLFMTEALKFRRGDLPRLQCFPIMPGDHVFVLDPERTDTRVRALVTRSFTSMLNASHVISVSNSRGPSNKFLCDAFWLLPARYEQAADRVEWVFDGSGIAAAVGRAHAIHTAANTQERLLRERQERLAKWHDPPAVLLVAALALVPIVAPQHIRAVLCALLKYGSARVPADPAPIEKVLSGIPGIPGGPTAEKRLNYATALLNKFRLLTRGTVVPPKPRITPVTPKLRSVTGGSARMTEPTEKLAGFVASVTGDPSVETTISLRDMATQCGSPLSLSDETRRAARASIIACVRPLESKGDELWVCIAGVNAAATALDVHEAFDAIRGPYRTVICFVPASPEDALAFSSALDRAIDGVYMLNEEVKLNLRCLSTSIAKDALSKP